MRKRLSIVLLAFLTLVFIWKLPPLWESNEILFSESSAQICHVYDEVGILSKGDVEKFNWYLRSIFRESDVDIRFVFIKDTGRKTIEEIAIEKVQELEIGRENLEERGLLLLYNMKDKRLRIEIGYGLESYFPDAFIGYLMSNHARAFFAYGDLSTGLRLLIFMIHHRIRETNLGNSFDPGVLQLVRHHEFLSGGAGASQVMRAKGQHSDDWHAAIAQEARSDYSPQPTPEAVYNKYLKWLASGTYDPKIEIFTPKSQGYVASFPMTTAYFDYILMQEYGKEYNIITRGNIALLYFTNDPLVSPHFFKKNERGWQMDIIAEINNTRNRVGGIYTWDYGGGNDIYTKTFMDKLINIKNYIRIIDGDNRELPVRSSS